MSKSKFNRKFRRSALCLALGISLGFVGGSALAQSNASGAIFGQADQGASVTIKSDDTGFERTVGVDSSGRFRLASLPTGTYTVTLSKDGQTISTRERILVNIAGGTEVSFAAQSSDATNLAGITVTATGVTAVDISSTDTKTVFFAEELRNLPVAQNITAVAFLAPSVISSSSYSGSGVRGGNVASFGGAAASENAYYINGYPVVNPLTSIGFTELPYGAIDQMQVLTGGYGAEFGRSTGGVINVITKRGTNDWKAGAQVQWKPEFLKADRVDQMYPNTGYAVNAPTDGTLYAYRKENTSWNYTMGAYVGGPIVQDRLFVYLAGDIQKQQGDTVRNVKTTPANQNRADGWNHYKYRTPRWAAKVDWNISDNHLVEFTAVGDSTEYNAKYSRFNYNGLVHDQNVVGGTTDEDKTELDILKYTGYLTDNLTLTALYGQQKIDHISEPLSYRADCPRIIRNTGSEAPGITYAPTCQSVANVILPGSNDKTDGGRIDLEWRVGNHDLRFGLDKITANSLTGSETAGGNSWTYNFASDKNAAVDASNGVIGSPASAGGSGNLDGQTKGYYVTKGLFSSAASVRVDQSAQYIEDRWQVSDNVLLSLGVRRENFVNYNGDLEKYIEQKNQIAPRIGFSWDLRGDSSIKIFGNAGRYHLALPAQVAVRGASGTFNGVEYFTYTGTDPNTGAPTGLSSIALDKTNPSVCPGTNFVSSNQECGVAPDPRTVAAKGINPHFQDEFILGMQHELTPQFNYGAKGTYRSLISAIDDTCAQILGGRCFLFNPGANNTFQLDNGDGTFNTVTYTREQMGLPKLGRYYWALDLYGEHPLHNNWYGKINYTYSKNFGNTEGQLNSDTDTGAGGQADVSVTLDWDLPQLMVGANGLLPNNRSHQFKGLGYYEFSKEWRVGATAIIQSGRPRSCTSFYPRAEPGLYNGSFYYYCGYSGSGTPASPAGPDYRFSPRGTYGETPWTYQLNMNVVYKPAWVENLTLQLDVLNVLDKQTPQFYYSRNMTNRTTYNSRFGQELNFMDPRTVMLTARYDFDSK